MRDLKIKIGGFISVPYNVKLMKIAQKKTSLKPSRTLLSAGKKLFRGIFQD